MNKEVPTIVVAVMAVVVCALVFTLTADNSFDSGGSDEDPPVFYNIDYKIDGSMMPSSYLSKYQYGVYASLPIPESDDGSYFCGWYTDEGLTKPLGAITAGTKGDLQLYPMWSEDPFGKVFTFKTKVFQSGLLNNKLVEYTFKIIYGQESNGMRLMGFSISETINGADAAYEDDSYWISEFYGNAKYYGNITEQDKEMAVWTLSKFAFVVYNGYPSMLLFSDIKCDTVVESVAEKYNIEYNYDKSVMHLTGYVPTMYCEGLYTVLPSVKSSYFFEGWYEDESESIPIGAVLSNRSGDISLYPGLIDSIDGRGYRMGVTSHFSYLEGNGNFNLNPIVSVNLDISGTSEWMYVTHKGSSYYIINSVELNYVKSMTRFGSTTTSEWIDNNSNSYWSEFSSGIDKKYLGNTEYNGELCAVWGISEEDCYVTVYLYRNFIPYYICFDYGKYCMYFTFIEEIRYEGTLEFDPIVIAGKDIEVDGVESVNIGDSITLTASGKDFIGWYENGEFITDSNTVTIECATPNIVYEARERSPPYILDKDSQNIDIPGLHGKYRIYDANWCLVSDDSLTEGTYCIVDDCTPYSHYVYVTTGYKTVTFDWIYNDKSYSMSIDISQADVDRVLAFDDGIRNMYSSAKYVEKYFTKDDMIVREIAKNLVSYRDSLNLSDAQFAQFVLNFVQGIDYYTDSESHGVEEYFKYPVEYVWDGGGDCEDSAIMYSTLMSVLGYKAGIVIFKDHCMSIISVNGITGSSESVFIDNDHNYYYLCETTATGWLVGKTSNHQKYTNETAVYIYYVG